MSVSRPLILVAVLAIAMPASAQADARLHPLFTDHMVLQRATSIPIWGTADPGETINVRLHRQTSDFSESNVADAVADASGNWKASLPLPLTFGPYEMTVTGKNTLTLNDVLLGEVWICSGQSNMEWRLDKTFEPAAAIRDSANPLLRLFTVQRSAVPVPATTVETNGWQECGPATVTRFSAVSYYFGRDLQAALKIPVGLIHTSWGGTPAQAWTSQPALDAVPALHRYHLRGEPNPAPSQNSPGALFNGMIAPLVPFSFRGVIWYQGESNSGAAYEYRTLFPTMIADWRRQWGRDFPFLCVQLAPFKKIENSPKESDWAELREAQWMTTRALPNVGMAVITDVGEENDIHPGRKEPVSARLALLARRIAYCQPIIADGPTYRGMAIHGNRVILTFDSTAGGLVQRGDKLTGFTIAGSDRKFVNAEAWIHGNMVVVQSPQVAQPVAVRFGWATYPVVNLWNAAGLPATPFRTDDWPGVTAPK